MKIQLAAAIIINLVIFSCRKDQDTVVEEKTPAKYNRGTPQSAPVQQVIGPEGGVIAFPDGRMRIKIPAGAVKSATDFTISTVSNTLPLSTGFSYRLGPENIQFEQPVEISFNYNAADLDGTPEDLLYLGYQDSDGYWHLLADTKIDKEHQVLKVKTKHFSDWAVVREFTLKADKTELSENETATFKASFIDVYHPKDKHDNDYLLAPVVELKNENVSGWKVHGGGTISSGKSITAVYTAPASIQSPKTAQVEVTLKRVVSRSEPDRPGNTGTVIMLAPIKLLPGEYVKWTISGEEFMAEAFVAQPSNGKTFVTAMHPNSNLSIGVHSVETGTFSFGNADKPGNAGMMAVYNQIGYSSSYDECNTGKIIYSDGHVNFSKFGAVGEYIQGSFSASLYDYQTCILSTKKAVGTFRIKRRY